MAPVVSYELPKIIRDSVPAVKCSNLIFYGNRFKLWVLLWKLFVYHEIASVP